MSITNFSYLLAFILISKVQTQLDINCPEKCDVDQNAVVSDFLGVWYLQRYSSSFIDETMKCIFWNVTRIEGNTAIGTFNYRLVR